MQGLAAIPMTLQMVAPLFAMPPPQAFTAMRVGIVLVLLTIGIFVKVTASKKRGPHSERNRRAGLGLLAIICGPLAGAGLAALKHAFGDVHPRDITFTYYMFMLIGGLAGFIIGMVLAVTSVFSPNDRPGEKRFRPYRRNPGTKSETRANCPWGQTSILILYR